jgi:hypothetical protein
MASILTPEDVVRRIAAECAYIDERGGVGIRLEPAAAIVRGCGVFRHPGGTPATNRLNASRPACEIASETGSRSAPIWTPSSEHSSSYTKDLEQDSMGSWFDADLQLVRTTLKEVLEAEMTRRWAPRKESERRGGRATGRAITAER